MDAPSDTRQTITRLTPLAALWAALDAQVKPIAPRNVTLDAAGGCVLAEDVVPPRYPRSALALLDGWALAADDTVGAGGYSPALLPALPQRVEVGQAVPSGTDCVAPFDAVRIAGGRAEVLTTINPGDGVLPAGGDCDGTTSLRHAGERLRAIDRAVLAAAGVATVSVREPRIALLPVRAHDIIEAAARLIARDIARRGGAAEFDDARDFGAALTAEGADAVVAIGGTGQGQDDISVRTLSRQGSVLAHGIALSPGETAAFGFAGTKPVLLLPGRLDAALAVWLVLGRRMLARLSAHHHDSEPGETLPLARKVASTVGVAELVPVRRADGRVEPLGTTYLSFAALARSDGWMLVPAESEGYSAGSPVQVRPWP